MQQILFYTHEICFSHAGPDGEQYYEPRFYRNKETFHLEPNEDAILVLKNCGPNWFRQGILHNMDYVNGRFEFAPQPAQQLCLYIRNYSDQAYIEVERGTELSALLQQSEIIFKIVGLPTDTCPPVEADHQEAGWTSNAEKSVNEMSEVYYVKIFKKE